MDIGYPEDREEAERRLNEGYEGTVDEATAPLSEQSHQWLETGVLFFLSVYTGLFNGQVYMIDVNAG